jgi:flavin-binding protein dodecin
MSVAKVTEITSSSTVGFDDAIEQGIKRASKTLQNIEGAWIKDAYWEEATMPDQVLQEWLRTVEVWPLPEGSPASFPALDQSKDDRQR